MRCQWSVSGVLACCLVGCSGGGSGSTTPPRGVPRIASFTATPATVVAGQSSRLDWMAHDAARLALDPGGQEVTGLSGLEVRPSVTTVYTLRASAGSEVATATVTVTVTPAVTPMVDAELGPNGSLKGGRVFPQDSPWNQDISAAPVHPDSEGILAFIGLDRGLKADFGSGTWNGGPIGIPYYVVDRAQAPVTVRFTAYGDESDPGPMPVPSGAPVEGGAASTGDRHVLVLDRDAGLLYELYRAFPRGDGGWDADSAAVWDLTSNAQRPWGWTSADAAGLPLFPGLARYDEVAAGAIRHALRFTVPTTRRAYVSPASHWASSNTSTSAPPMGMRVRLKADKDLGGFPPQARTVLEALKRYGMILADNGSAWFLSGAPDPRWDNDQLATLGRIKGSDLEVVSTGGVHASHPQGAPPVITSLVATGGSPGKAVVTWTSTGATRHFLSGLGLVRGGQAEVPLGGSVTLTAQGPHGQATGTLILPNH